MRCTASTQNHFVGVILEEAWVRGAVYSRWKTFERTKFATRLSQQALHRPRLKKRERKRKKEKEGRLFSGLSRCTNVFRKISSRYAHFYGPDGGSTWQPRAVRETWKDIYQGRVAFAVLVINRDQYRFRRICLWQRTDHPGSIDSVVPSIVFPLV